MTHTFDGSHFYLARTGKQLSITAKQSRNGRWKFVDPDGKTIASGVTPEQFVKTFWFGTLTPTN